jgi:hypothetical protein
VVAEDGQIFHPCGRIGSCFGFEHLCPEDSPVPFTCLHATVRATSMQRFVYNHSKCIVMPPILSST